MKRLVLAALTCAVALSSHAANFTVTNLNNAGAGSLRDAVAQANANPGPDVITFDVTGTIVLTSGQISINDPVTITGPGANLLTIDANANSRVFSVFENVADVCVTPGADFPVTISGLTLTNARATANIPGGAIYSEKTLTLDSVVISNSQAKGGGGLAWFTRYAGQRLTISDSQFAGNVARLFPSSDAAVSQRGGGLLAVDRCVTPAVSDAEILIERSVFANNHIQPTTLPGASGAGLEITGEYHVYVVDTRITGNSIDPPATPPAGANYRGGGIRVGYAWSLQVESSEISDNVADRQSGLSVFNDLASRQTTNGATALDLLNSTVSGNVGTGPAGPGGVFLFANVRGSFSNSTISNNTTQGGAAGIRVASGPTFPATGSDALPPTVRLRSTIVSGSPDGRNDIGVDAATVPSLVVDAEQSLIGLLQSGVTVTGSGNKSTTAPLLGALTFNGGPTRTQALLPGSPAIDAGSNPLGFAYDQRGPGFPRTNDGTTDMGAYESAAAPPPPATNQPIPTLSEYALMLLALLLAAAGSMAIRRRA